MQQTHARTICRAILTYPQKKKIQDKKKDESVGKVVNFFQTNAVHTSPPVAWIQP